MALSRKQIDTLLRTLSLTQASELTCDECAQQLSEFAENNLEGRSVPEGLQAVEHHLEICDECREEFQALMKVLQDS